MKTAIITILSTLLILVGCAHSEREEISREKDSTEMLLTSSSNFENSEDIQISGIDFTIVLNESGDTTHWSTIDNRFKTPEGFRVGTTWSEIPIDLKTKLRKAQGWAYYIELDSKWALAFCDGESCTDIKPTTESKVKWIYKRNN